MRNRDGAGAERVMIYTKAAEIQYGRLPELEQSA